MQEKMTLPLNTSRSSPTLVGSSFIQTMMGPGPQCYLRSSKSIGIVFPEKNNFERLNQDMGVVAILVI